MKRAIFFVFFLLAAIIAPAQEIHYPASVKALFERADAAILPDGSQRPLIAVPQSSASLVKKIQRLGASAVIIPPTWDGTALNEMAAAWDGVALEDGWVKEKDAFSVLFYKAVADRNIPHTGTSALSQEIDRGLMRCDGALPSLEALCKKAQVY